MKKISVLIALGMLMIAPWGMAQTIYDGAKLTGKDLNGTARFVGMGGAMYGSSWRRHIYNGD